jgi:PAS domain S-box-containing protein
VFYKLSFADKIVVLTLPLLAVLGVAWTVGFQLVLRSRLHDEVGSSTRMLAVAAAEQASPLLAKADARGLADFVTRLGRIDDTIAYALVVDRAGEVAAHTFSWDPPSVILARRGVPSPVGGDEYRIVRFDGHTYLDVVAPILSGTTGVGTLQVGIGVERIDRFVGRLNLLFLAGLGGLTFLGMVGARIFFRYATRPIVELTRLADQVSVGDLKVDFDFGVPVQCWEIKNCGREDCAAYRDTSVQCWFVDGTPCEGYEPRFPQKLMGCRTCEVYRKHKGDEIVQLYDSFRHMTHDLQAYQEEVERSNRFQGSLIHNSFDGIIATDETDKVRIFNRIAQNLTGYTEEDVVGKMTWHEIFVSELSRDMQQPLFEDGSGVIFGFYRQEQTLRRKDGGTVDVRASGITLEEEGQHVGKVFFFQDLGEIKKLREELIQKGRLAATGQTVASISHSVKNILDGLRGGAHVYNRGVRIEDPALRKEGWVMVQRNIDRISGLVADLLNYAQDRKPALERIDPNELIADVATTLQAKAEGQGTNVEVHPDDAVSRWMLDAHAVHQLLMNLVNNALDATAGIAGGWVCVSTHLTEGDELELRVQDNGPGVPLSLIDNLFVSVVSTKGSRGTGLGLPVVYKIAKEHGGTVVLDTEMGSGATFRVFIPRGSDNDLEDSVPASEPS